MNSLTCAACGRGTLAPSRARRSSGALVALGFLLMALAAFGTVIGTVSVMASGWAAEQAKRTPEEVRADLLRAAVPDPVIEQVMAGDPVERAVVQSLAEPQQLAVMKGVAATLAREAPMSQLVVASGVFVAIALAVGVGGFLLARKRTVLRCTSCTAVAPAR